MIAIRSIRKLRVFRQDPAIPALAKTVLNADPQEKFQGDPRALAAVQRRPQKAQPPGLRSQQEFFRPFRLAEISEQ